MKQRIALFVEPDAEHEADRTALIRSALDRGVEVQSVGSIGAAESLLTEIAESGRGLEVALLPEEPAELRDQLIDRIRAAFPQANIVVCSDAATCDPTRADSTVTSAWAEPARTLLPALRRGSIRASRSREIRVLGESWDTRAHEVKSFFCRYRVPYRWVDVEHDRRRTKTDVGDRDLPLVIFPDGTELENPSREVLAEKLGFGIEPAGDFYDLVVVGAGPAGLAAAVYASSEGLRTLVIERQAPGGQAGASALIENYFGFPEGISGGELTRRGVAQAQRFRAELLVTRAARGIEADGSYRIITLDDGSLVCCHAVLIATGVQYNLLNVPNAERMHGRGIYYGAASAEASRYRDRDVCILGGGNSAGQAAMLLARYAANVHVIMSKPDLSATMSRYLAERLRSTPNIRLIPSATVAEVHGDENLEQVVIQHGSDAMETIPTQGLFVFIGAKPRTEWVENRLVVDRKGFLVTGRDLHHEDLGEEWDERWPMRLETSMPGVFAAGDVRHGSAKRIGSAVGEGAMATQLVHEYLKDR
jgi:thioredoxin reductase (NADPH)